MWFNGFLVAIDGALSQMGNPSLARHRDALVLGCFREDVWYLRGIGAVTQNPSLDHFCRRDRRGGFIPWITRDAGACTEKLARRAVRAWRSGRVAQALVDLGRAAHPVIDMACPVHAQGVAHGDDPYEWRVEAMAQELRRLPAAEAARCEDFAQAARDLAGHAQKHRIARTRDEADAQARALMPLAAAHTRALFERFVAQAGDTANPREDRTGEALGALGMPRAGLAKWFAQLEGFAHRHGGERHYAELLDFVHGMQARLDE
ncbi:hypothetical protein BWI17_14000 [Betaproteobacteria bacterium GR16-43]|nr:hypothetical protein BWI17_14000 [Betaproteobacteria bacterium GR16-43]